MLGSVVFALLAVHADALHLRPAAEENAECRVRMHNDQDMDFTVDLKVDGQVLRVIPDTGSFAAVLFSDSCASCGARKKLLHTERMKHLDFGDHRAVQSYGSGQTLSVDARAPAGMACNAGTPKKPQQIHADEQMFWLTVKAELPVAGSSTFQGIFGLGPPRSDAKVAAVEAQSARKEVAGMKANGYDVSRYAPLVENLFDVANFTKTVKPWLKNEGVVTFSVCLSSDFGKDGVLIFNDRQVVEHPKAFKHIDVDTDGLFWQAEMSHIRLGDYKDDAKIRTRGSTKAVLDTGTSLIGAPAWFVEAVVAFVNANIHKLGCDDASQWPPLTFKLDGTEVSLPGSSYIGKVATEDGNFSGASHIFRRMPHLSNGFTCTALVFSTSTEAQDFARKGGQRDESTFALESGDEGPEWIFGIPFFRAYYTAFQLTRNSMGPHKVFLADAAEDCNVVERVNSDLRRPFAEKRVAPATIDPSKLHLPSRSARRTGQHVYIQQQLGVERDHP